MELTKQEISREFQAILHYWKLRMTDPAGGFYGRIDANEQVDPEADKGVVLNARILWTFAAAYNHGVREEDLNMALRAADYIHACFNDTRYGGVFWSVTAGGKPADTKKQVYAQAFTIYGLAECYRAAGRAQDLELAIALFRLLEKHSFDPLNSGYLEAFLRDWGELADLRLSEKDANEKKTMNTHLHVLEAYTVLYQVWPDPELKQQLLGLLTVFLTRIYDPQTRHLRLFMDENWVSKLAVVSYGHDIEASWLLLEAAAAVNDEEITRTVRALALDLAGGALEGLAGDGAMIYEYDPASGHSNTERHWWVQAEAMVGFLTAARLTNDATFSLAVQRLWDYIQLRIIDPVNGEWFWGRKADGSLMEGEDKAGFWKCPYHNGRACIELLKRL
ncbi:N-acyl-D-glucosamine 2-epimerase [Pedobacter yulinensis]|uniref:Cellobiose 2-epimerase n=2 Tax=Pedobacter yulinensis TaxID=2126353 RepID=A0A2T3HMV9_9SPHI|nr:N-acyl-D-glucosamine 2-epimerase [Pedobacter yulinensis]